MMKLSDHNDTKYKVEWPFVDLTQRKTLLMHEHVIVN